MPCYCFGETDLYYQIKFMDPLRRWLVKRCGVAVMLVIGQWRWGLPALPRRGVQLTLCVGRPIEVGEAVEAPSKTRVDEVHALYMARVKEVFDTFKAECGYEGAELSLS